MQATSPNSRPVAPLAHGGIAAMYACCMCACASDVPLSSWLYIETWLLGVGLLGMLTSFLTIGNDSETWLLSYTVARVCPHLTSLINFHTHARLTRRSE